MPLSLSETQAVLGIANFLYPFLPGKPHPFTDQRISFAGIAYELGLENFWQGGSKLPAITALLENTLERKRDVFCSLILEIVRRGIKYRDGKRKPITREEIEILNELIFEVKFKIPKLWDKNFLKSLPSQSQKATNDQPQNKQNITQDKRKELINDLMQIGQLPPQERGFSFERFLNKLFEVFNLKPRSSFRLTGEQIDGSIELDGETYLIEAKWESKQTAEQDLLSFHGKIKGKAAWSRGIFISYNGFTEESLTAFSKGRPTNLITFNAQDLYFILEGYKDLYLNLDAAIRVKVRYAAETGNIGMPVQSLLRNRELK